MVLFALGINHKSANIAVRERVAFTPERMADAHRQLLAATDLAEVVILSTCNRTELFVVSDTTVELGQASVPSQVWSWMSAYHGIELPALIACSYCHSDIDALRHMIKVCSGLDSLVLGEPQIFGQMKSAFAVAQEAATVGIELQRVFPHLFSVAKKVRTDTAIGKNPVSVAFAAVSLSRHIFADLSKNSALLIGAGETIELVARHLVDGGVKDIVVANRTLEHAQQLAQQFGAEAVLLADIPEQLVHADIVITSTASQLPILGKGAVEQALKARKHRPMLMVDIAVPRDIEEQVDELDDVYLYTVDDLTEIVDENRRSRETEVGKADEIINVGLEKYLQQLASLDVVSTLKAYRKSAEQTRDLELEKAFKDLEKGQSPEQVINQLARNLTNKMMHQPSITMKQAGAQGRNDLIDWAHDLFGLNDNNVASDGDVTSEIKNKS